MKLKKLKKILVITLIVALAGSVQGCGGGGNDQEYEEEYEDEDVEDEEDVEEDAEEDENEESETMRVGSEEHGFVSVPSDWIQYQELNADALETQYCDPSGAAIITLFAEHNSEGDPEEVARETYAVLEGNEDLTLEAAKGEIMGYETTQIVGESSSTGRLLLRWFFEPVEGSVYSVGMDGMPDEIEFMTRMIEATFGVEE